MANIKSAVKRIRQTETRNLRNRQHRSQMRTMIKKFRALLEEGKADEARQLLPQVYSIIDKKARKGIIHRNTAARYKSRLTRRLASLQTEGGSA